MAALETYYRYQVAVTQGTGVTGDTDGQPYQMTQRTVYEESIPTSDHILLIMYRLRL
jgi:hypothetical protein